MYYVVYSKYIEYRIYYVLYTITQSGSFSGKISRQTSQKIAENCQKFKNSDTFDIYKVWPVGIRRHILENRRFGAILGGFCKKTWSIFRFFWKIA